MAIKFSQLPQTASISGNILIPVVTVGISSNVLQTFNSTALNNFIYSAISGNLATINNTFADLYSNAASQNTSLGTINSSISSQASSISTLQSQVTTLFANAATQDSQITAVQASVLAGVVNTLTVSAPLNNTGNSTRPSLTVTQATTSASGYLSSTDWNTFNNKAPTASPTFTGTVTLPAVNSGGSIVPTANVTYNLGSTTGWWNNIYGTAIHAQYADLAELYLADAEYPIGTVLMVGGEAEVTASEFGSRAIGVVSENPSYLMNSGLEGGTKVALKGRVPVRVVGAVRKGQNLVAATGGCATAAVYHSSEVFAIALATSADTDEKLIEAVIL